jgi:CRP-like cAMP-binding protein
MDRAVLVDVLRDTSLFAGFSETELEAVPKVGRQRHHESGEQIVGVDGRAPRTMWVVIQGEVTVETDGNVICTLGPGDYFGEMALLAPELSRTADVVARSRTETFELQREHLLGLCSSSPEIALGVMAELARRLHETTASLRQVMAASPEARTAADQLGVSVGDEAHESVAIIDQPERPSP